jgi:phenylpyruvate tautomerase PptA (4-oxalocrotonate tautomerase family)
MPHVVVHLPERQLVGREPELIGSLTDAVLAVYGEWAREHLVVRLDGVPPGRWGVGGRVVDDAAPAVTFGIRAAALSRPDGSEIAARLAASVTDALAGVLGEQTRSGISVEFVATPPGQTAVAGAIVA